MMMSKLRSEKKGYHIIVPILGWIVFFYAWLHAANSFGVQANTYPNRPIAVVVPFGPGSAADLPTRAIANGLSRDLKVPLTVENKPGAFAMLGPSAVLKAKRDGYTILSCSDASLVAGPLVSPNPPYDPFKDFLSIGCYGGFGFAYAVRTDSPFKTLDHMIRAAKENPGKLTLAFTNPGGPAGISIALLKKEAGIDFKYIIGKEAGSIMQMLLGKHVDMLYLGTLAVLPYIKSGEMRFLAVAEPVPGYTFPTLAEAGYPKVTKVATTYMSIQVSSKTPKPICDKLISSLSRVSKQPETVKAMQNIGMRMDYKGPAEFTDILKEKWDISAGLVKELDMKEEK